MLNFKPSLRPHPTTEDHDLHNVESTLSKVASTQVSAFQAKWFLKRRFFNNIHKFSINHNHLPLIEGLALYFNKLKVPLQNNALCQIWFKLTQWFWSRSWKSKRFADRRTDGWTMIWISLILHYLRMFPYTIIIYIAFRIIVAESP